MSRYFCMLFAYLLLPYMASAEIADIVDVAEYPEPSPAAIQLLPHQQFPVDYLAAHPDIRGLLINHYMGTGKTYLALGLAERFQDKKIVIIAPRFIEAHWHEHIRNFGVKNLRRFQFYSYNDAPEALTGRDLKDTIIIYDEVHNLIKMIRSPDATTSHRFSDLYDKSRQAFKLLALSGTPIYSSEHDFAYLINLVSGENQLPFNEEEFRLGFTEIKRVKSFWRGYVSESQLLKFSVPFWAAFLAVPLVLTMPAVGVPVLLGGAALGFLSFPLVNNAIAPIDHGQLRGLNVAKFKPYISKYVSFYEIAGLDLSEFPSKTVLTHDIAYNKQQFEFFLNFAELGLNSDQLTRIFRDIDEKMDSGYLNLNSSNLQTKLVQIPGAGREIGNFDFIEDGQVVESPKFMAILDQMRKQNMPQSVIYSSYVDNGIKAFARFLDRHELEKSYAILTPDLAQAQFADLVRRYNEGKIKILLLHPEITEGISLKNTRQFHVLEPVLNNTLLDQVIARGVRYKSHETLPPDQRHVDVHIWKATIGSGWSVGKLRKTNWFRRYSELSDWSDWGPGQRQIDKNYDRKKQSPDEAVFLTLQSVDNNLVELKQTIKENSIEKQPKT